MTVDTLTCCWEVPTPSSGTIRAPCQSSGSVTYRMDDDYPNTSLEPHFICHTEKVASPTGGQEEAGRPELRVRILIKAPVFSSVLCILANVIWFCDPLPSVRDVLGIRDRPEFSTVLRPKCSKGNDSLDTKQRPRPQQVGGNV